MKIFIICSKKFYDKIPENIHEGSEEERLKEEVLDRFADIMCRPGAIAQLP